MYLSNNYYNNIQMPQYANYVSSRGGKPKQNMILSKEISQALSSESTTAQNNYFTNLVNNASLIFRNYTNEDILKSVQLLLDSITLQKFSHSELLTKFMELIHFVICPNAQMARNLDFTNLKTMTSNDSYVLNLQNAILSSTNKLADLSLTHNKEIDIYSKGEFPISLLSNFSETDFNLDGVRIKSMEGFLQSLKTPDKERQTEICLMEGTRAKGIGKKLNKNRKFDFKHLYWNGQNIDRFSADYQNLLKRAYEERYNSDELFRLALDSTKGCILKHSLGEKDKMRTLLTEEEFISILTELRDKTITEGAS